MWTADNRPRYNRDKLRYPSDLTDAEWAHLGLEIGQDAGQGAVKDRRPDRRCRRTISRARETAEQGRQQRETAVAILNVGGGDDAVQQQALRIDQNMPLLALDQLAGIEAVRRCEPPFFSAFHTLTVDDAGRGAGFAARLSRGT